MNHLLYHGWYIVRHKWFVFVECCKLSVPLLGILHDISRLRPSEFLPYLASAPYSKDNKPASIANAFEFAWNDHQHRNKHHWEYWVHFDYHDHSMRILPMPDRYRREMLADWRGAARAKRSKMTVWEWYTVNQSRMLLHPQTRTWIEQQLNPVEQPTEPLPVIS